MIEIRVLHLSFKIAFDMAQSHLLIGKASLNQARMLRDKICYHDFTGLPDALKTAREYALLGNYDTALVYFQQVFAQIDQYVANNAAKSDLCVLPVSNLWCLNLADFVLLCPIRQP